MKEIDLIERINILLDALKKDAKNTKNTIIFDYDITYPRFFKINSDNILKALENIAKVYLYNQKNAKLTISFKLTNYSLESINFEIGINSSYGLDQFNSKYLQLAKQYVKNLNSEIKFTKNTISFNCIIETGDKKQESPNILKNLEIKKYHAVIAYDDEKAFNILKSWLGFIGLDVKPSNDFNNLIMHATDSIYKPDILFIHKKFLSREYEFDKLLRFKKIKKYCIVVICDLDNEFENLQKKELIILEQPFTYDSVYGALNTCYMLKK